MVLWHSACYFGLHDVSAEVRYALGRVEVRACLCLEQGCRRILSAAHMQRIADVPFATCLSCSILSGSAQFSSVGIR